MRKAKVTRSFGNQDCAEKAAKAIAKIQRALDEHEKPDAMARKSENP
jgi:hypothetical protein